MNGESAEHEARLKLVEEHLRAENDHDLDAIMATFGQNAKFNLNGMPLNDRESIRAMYGGFGFGGQGSFPISRQKPCKSITAIKASSSN